ncbi:MAG: protein-glutamate O-methyltransferase CheR [Clostridia bacterium]|nr:protein-glutamate O-methyltransferase CheR [Clostridia bacterium]
MMDYEGFKTEIYKMTDINLSLYKEKQMKRRIDSLISKNGFADYSEYVKALKGSKALFNEFINYLTINVSEFYRNPEQWEVLEKEIFPMLLNKTRKIKIWSAACSTGDEPYTLAMVLNKLVPLTNVKIVATDIDREVLSKAQNGIYTSRSLASLPKAFLDNHFTKSGDSYKVKDELKNCIEFRHHNLLKDAYEKEFDMIVCRNVLIYFTEEAKSEIYKKFNDALRDDGILFVGSTEQIIQSVKYNFKPLKTFFYLKSKEV